MAFLAALNAANRGGLTPNAQLTASKEFNRFLTHNALAFDAESSIAWLMTEAVDTALGEDADIPRVMDDEDELCARCVAVAGADGVLYDPAGAENQVIEQGIPSAAFNLLLDDAGKALYWLLDLTACHQVKPLNARNIANYFRANSRVNISGREILKVVDFAAITIERIMGNEQYVALLEDSKFMTYHTSYSSSAKLAVEMIDSAPGVTHVFFSAATRAAIAASAADPSNRALNEAIPEQVILATHAYLSAFGKLPENWFQGDRAKTSLPASKYNVYLAVFRRLRTLSANTEAIEAAGTAAALVGLIGADMRGV